MSFEALSKTFTGEFPVQAPMERVFPLFSPLGEREWAPGWAPELLFPAGAEWAEEMIFRTLEETGEAVWIVTGLDLNEHRVVYHRVEPGRYVARVEVQCRSVSNRRTSVRTTYRFVGLSGRGNEEIEAMTQAAYDAKMERWMGWVGDAAARLASG
jgi:hypothetical protein